MNETNKTGATRMSKIYRYFSVDIPLDAEALSDVMAALHVIQDPRTDWYPGGDGREFGEPIVFEKVFPHASGVSDKSYCKIAIVLYKAIVGTLTFIPPEGEKTLWPFEYLSVDQIENHRLRITTTNGNLAKHGSEIIAGAVITALQQHLGVEPMGFSWSDSDSNLSSEVYEHHGEHHGGAVWMEPKHNHFRTTRSWLADQQKESHARASAQANAGP